jgi:hypothetical protein
VVKKLGAARDKLGKILQIISYRHEYGCLDKTKQELQNILTMLDPAIGKRDCKFTQQDIGTASARCKVTIR